MTFSQGLKILLVTLNLSPSFVRAEEVESGKGKNSCIKIYQNSMQHYHALAKFLPKNYGLRDSLASHQFLKQKGDACELFESADLFQKVASLHSDKIAVMLPLSRWSPDTQRSMINQLKGYFVGQGLDPEKQLLILDTQGQIQIMQQQLAQLVFTQHISVIVGGLTQAEAPVLTKWATQLRIPTIILNRKSPAPRNRFVFRVGPDQSDLAHSLLAYAEGQGFKKIAVMMPQSSRDGSFAEALQANGKTEIVGPFLYNASDYSSIDHSFKRLFHLNDDSRKQELLDLINEQKERSKQEGVAFDPKGLMLPPKVDMDALVIIDHFKNVRHLPLLGIPKWRAPEIVDQDEENLRKAVFVDYVGSYERLPYGIQATTVMDENFIEGQSAARVDLELVVTHGLAAASQAIKGPRISRLALYKRIEAALPEDKSFFGPASFFRKDHEGNWPTFLFAVQKGKLAAIGKNLGLRPPPAKAKAL